MKNLEIDFVLRENEKIKIILPEPLDMMDVCGDASIFLLKDAKQYLLSTTALCDNMRIFGALLEDALNNQLQLHPSIQKDIGYLLNQYWQEKKDPGLFYVEFEWPDYWVGNNYRVWNHELAAWLYNDEHGAIIMYITPVYPRRFAMSKSGPSYKKWIADYQPVLKLEIPRDVAQQWVEQAQKIVDIIEWNSNNWDTRIKKG